MVAATKKKRGRHVSEHYSTDYYIHLIQNGEDLSQRVIRNRKNAEDFMCLLIDKDEYGISDFFMTREGTLKHNGIAEQIGRMLYEDAITADQAIATAANCINAYNSGMTSKEIEKRLRQYRISRKKGATNGT